MSKQPSRRSVHTATALWVVAVIVSGWAIAQWSHMAAGLWVAIALTVTAALILGTSMEDK